MVCTSHSIHFTFFPLIFRSCHCSAMFSRHTNPFNQVSPVIFHHANPKSVSRSRWSALLCSQRELQWRKLTGFVSYLISFSITNAQSCTFPIHLTALFPYRFTFSGNTALRARYSRCALRFILFFNLSSQPCVHIMLPCSFV